jgi:hypothetical protein
MPIIYPVASYTHPVYAIAVNFPGHWFPPAYLSP